MCQIKITLAAARVNAGMTQIQAAEALGVSQNTICSWENGRTPVSKTAALALSQAYNMPLEAIILPREFSKSEQATA